MWHKIANNKSLNTFDKTISAYPTYFSNFTHKVLNSCQLLKLIKSPNYSQKSQGITQQCVALLHATNAQKLSLKFNKLLNKFYVHEFYTHIYIYMLYVCIYSYIAEQMQAQWTVWTSVWCLPCFAAFVSTICTIFYTKYGILFLAYFWLLFWPFMAMLCLLNCWPKVKAKSF